jgi:hypothetical protein
MIEIFENHYNELTQKERDTITTTDYETAKSTTFESVADFKEYAKIYFE